MKVLSILVLWVMISVAGWISLAAASPPASTPALDRTTALVGQSSFTLLASATSALDRTNPLNAPSALKPSTGPGSHASQARSSSTAVPFSSAGDSVDVLCLLGPERSFPDGPEFDVNQLRHCTCPESVALFINSDRVYEAALMWNGTGIEEPYGAFAERYETPNDQPGAICSVNLQVTDNGNRIRSNVDIYVWNDDNGRPGDVAGILRGNDLGPVPVWPRYATRELEVYENQLIGVQGAFWVGIRGAWDRDSCSVYIPMDLEGDHPETIREGMTYVGPGTPFPEGWQSIETVYGQPAALAIGVIVGWCPVPVERMSWGRVKATYR